tara:strand:- start:262 stop:957 length:696 start_codon:yes stop_codon:yes gene_type:complete
MKIAILSDIHGNYTALKAVLRDVENEGVKKLFCLGDYVGYYYEPEKCIDLLFNWDIECVRGNHENMLFEIIKNSKLLEYYKNIHGSGIEEALEKLNSKHLQFLEKMPETLEVIIKNFNFILCHGSPWDVNYYLYPDREISVFKKCASLGKDFVLLGHTHRQMIKKVDSTIIINPGSVGQPRDKNKGACWALLDLEKKKYILKTTKYNSMNEIAQVNNNDPEKNQLVKYLTF